MNWVYITVGALGFPVFHLVDIAAIKRLLWAKPLSWVTGCAMIAASAASLCASADRFTLPIWAVALGWFMLTISSWQLAHALFINLPFYKTYVRVGVGDQLITSGLYALVRHPGVYALAAALFSLALVSGSRMMLAAAGVWMTADIIVVGIQDKYFLG